MKQFYQSVLLFFLKMFSRMLGQRYYTVEYRTSLGDSVFQETQLEGTNFSVPVFRQNLEFDYQVKGTKLKGTAYVSLADMLVVQNSEEILKFEICQRWNLPFERVTLKDVSNKRSLWSRLKYTLSSTVVAWGMSNGKA